MSQINRYKEEKSICRHCVCIDVYMQGTCLHVAKVTESFASFATYMKKLPCQCHRKLMALELRGLQFLVSLRGKDSCCILLSVHQDLFRLAEMEMEE